MDKAGLSEIARSAALCRPLPGSAGAAEWQLRARLDDPLSQPRLDRTAANGPAREGVKFSALNPVIPARALSARRWRCELRSALHCAASLEGCTAPLPQPGRAL